MGSGGIPEPIVVSAVHPTAGVCSAVWRRSSTTALGLRTEGRQGLMIGIMPVSVATLRR